MDNLVVTYSYTWRISTDEIQTRINGCEKTLVVDACIVLSIAALKSINISRLSMDKN